MSLDAFREQTFAPALPPAGKRRAAAFGPHAGTKTVLAFACSLGWLVSPFHKNRELTTNKHECTRIIAGKS
jgi:hypothetical protein